MKLFPYTVCGLLLMAPAITGSAFAQSTGSRSTGSQSSGSSAPSAPSATARRPDSITPLDPNAPPPPAHPITMQQTRELLELMGYKKMEDNNWQQMITMNRRAAPFIPEDVWTDVQSGVSGIDYPALMEPIYSKYLSQEDAAKALEFYSTPAGKRVLQSMPQLLGESVAASQQKGREVGRAAIEKHRPEIEAAQKKYQQDHPSPGASGAPEGGPGGGGASPSSPSATPAPSTPPSGSTAKPQQ